jgi:predicted transcriptional regulator
MVDDRTVRLGIRRRLVVGHGGQRVGCSVFCPRELRSMHVDLCRRCARAAAIDDGSVTCVPEVGTSAAERSVGAAMGEVSIAIEASVAVAELARLAESNSWISVAVLDADHRELGLIQREQLVTAPQGASARDVARWVVPVWESSPLLDVVHRMVRERARALPVVGEAMNGVGILTDLDALRWAARSPSWHSPHEVDGEDDGADRKEKGRPPEPGG